MKFLCDHMLGTLAKWLRFLGYDTAYPGPLEDAALMETCAREGRVLLTRDKELASRAPNALRIQSEILEKQMEEVTKAFGLRTDRALSLCSLCNVQIVPLPREEARGQVPEGVFARQTEFWRCPSCHRVYWKGSHYDAMRRQIESLGNPNAPDGAAPPKA